MKDNDTLRNLVIAGAVFAVILGVGPMLLRPPDTRPPVTPVAGDTSGTAERPTSDVTPGELETVQPAEPPAPAHGLTATEMAEVETRILGSAPSNGVTKDTPPSPYRMRLTLSNLGASIESATMTDHADSLGTDARYRLLSLVEHEDGGRFRSLAIEDVRVDETTLVSLHDKRWHVGDVRATEASQSVEFWITIEKDGAPILKLTRSFTLAAQEREAHLHDLDSVLTVQNLSTLPTEVDVFYRGGVGVPSIKDSRMAGPFIDWGTFDGTRVAGDRLTHAEISSKADKAKQLFPRPAEPDARLTWAASSNTYFTCTVAPLTADGKDNTGQLYAVQAVDLDGRALTTDDVTVRFVTQRATIAAGASQRYPIDIYLGEKDSDSFKSIDRYVSRNYFYQISQGFGMCTFPFLVELMIWLLNTIVVVTHDYGLAIIVLVLIVRLLLHPITKKGQVNMVRMQSKMGEFAPRIEELKRKYGNDKARMQQEQMKLYREQGMNPGTSMISSCLPMFIQMPIWVALYLSLSNNILLRHEPLHFTWISDLTSPDALYTFSAPLVVPLFGWQLPSFNLLPILVAIFMYTQQKLQPKPKPNPNATDQQRQQQEMMQKMAPMMSIMMLVIFYKMPSGLNLYIMFSSMFGTIEQHRIRKHIKAHEEAGTLHKPPAAAKGGSMAEGAKKKRTRPTFFERLQKLADDAKTEQAQIRRQAKGKPKR